MTAHDPLAPSDATVPRSIEQAWYALESRRIENARLQQENADLRARLAADRCEACAGHSSGVAYCVNCGRPFAWRPGEERLSVTELRARLAACERDKELAQANYRRILDDLDAAHAALRAKGEGA